MGDSPLSQYLRLLRTKNEHTQDELAKMLGITRATYSHYETARLIPPTDALYKLSVYYKVSLLKLVRLSVLSSGKDNDNARTFEYTSSNDSISLEFDTIYNEFLDECADMTPDDLNKWITVDDREIIYYYHKLSAHDKRMISYFLKFAASKNKNQS